MQKIPIALIYDFDGTLAPGNMQEHNFIPSLGLTVEAFWEKAEAVAKRDNVDGTLVYMHLMTSLLNSEKNNSLRLTREMLQENGKDIEFFPGVTAWFDSINSYRTDAEIQHYIISSGLREMIRGTSIAKHMKEIFASDFIYDKEGNVEASGLGVNYTNKTQFLFRINKNTPDISDTRTINASAPDEEKPIPFHNMIYIGDGETDVPCLKVVRDQGGYGIAVYDPQKEKAKKVVEQLIKDNRVAYSAPADFTEGERLMNIAEQMIDIICEKQKLYRMRGL